MSNWLAQVLHFGVYLIGIAAWIILQYTHHAQGNIDTILAALIGTAGGSVLGYSIKKPEVKTP